VPVPAHAAGVYVHEAVRPVSSDSSQRLYERVASRIAAAVESGALRSGDRIPSVRELSRRDGVSVATVLHAYAQLEASGLLVARSQSGYYVRGRPAVPEPAVTTPPQRSSAVSVSSLVARVYLACHAAGPVGFGAAYTPFSLLPTRRLANLLAAAARTAEHHGAEYDQPPGHLPLRRQIARRSVDWGCALSPDELLVTNGATEALNLCLLAVARPGDVVAVESPAFFGILQILEAHGMRAMEIPCDPREGLRLDALETALGRQRIAAVVAIPSFSNPLGSCMSDANKEKLVGLLARKNVPLIEDDIFGDLHFGPTRPRVAKSFDRRGLVLLCGSFSKTLAQGFRIGWVAGGRYQEQLQLLKFSQSVTTATLPQRAIAAFLEGGGYDRHLRILRRKLAESMHRVAAAVGEHFPRGTRMSQPRGGMVLWVELPRGVSAIELHRKALGEGIAVTPGPVFSARQQLEGFIRLSTGQEWSGRTEAALVRLGQLVKELA
jgi:DNA-binding transcriptional MocR family regulator